MTMKRSLLYSNPSEPQNETTACFSSWRKSVEDVKNNEGNRPNEASESDPAIDDDVKIHMAQEEEAKALMVKDLNALSIYDRDQVYEDIHGVSTGIDETPELIESSLQEMDRQIHLISHKPAYDVAAAQNLIFVQGQKLRLMFLRAERFDAKAAAKRYVAYFDWKLDIFDKDLLCKDIALNDLHPDAVANIRAGWQQILPQRDSAGRAILFCSAFRFRQNFKSAIGVWQMMFYNMMAMMEDTYTQQSGIVYVMNCIGNITDVFTTNPTHPMYVTFWKNPRMFAVFPWRIEACHLCFNDLKCKPMMTMMTLRTGSYIRSRMRMHYGLPTECLYKLMTFGIPTTAIPLGIDGETLKTAVHSKWFKRRKAKEAWLLERERYSVGCCDNISLEFPGVELPSRHDVLLGRGRPTSDHSGNQVLHDILTTHRDEYDAAKGKGRKTELAQNIVGLIHQSSGRFLKRNDKIHGWWQEVPNDVAVEKVCHGFRAKRETRARLVLGTSSSSDKRSGTTSSSYRTTEVHGSGHNDAVHKRAKLVPRQSSQMTSAVTQQPAVVQVSDASDVDDEDRNIVGENSSQAMITLLEDTAVDTELTRPFSVGGWSSPVSFSTPCNPDIPSKQEEEVDIFLCELIANQCHCFNKSTKEVGSWMKSMDIMTVGDLYQACKDTEFIESSMLVDGGLKEFWRASFIKAVKTEANNLIW